VLPTSRALAASLPRRPSDAHQSRILLLERLGRERGIRVDLGLNLVAIATIVHQRGRDLSSRELWEGCSNPVGGLILAEVAYDFPHAQTGSADLRGPTARFVGKVNPGAVPHSQCFIEQLLRDICDRSAITRRSRLEVPAQRSTEPHRGQHSELCASRLRLDAASVLATACRGRAPAGRDSLFHDRWRA